MKSFVECKPPATKEPTFPGLYKNQVGTIALFSGPVKAVVVFAKGVCRVGDDVSNFVQADKWIYVQPGTAVILENDS